MLAQPAHHVTDRVGDVIVAGSAEIRQAAGDGQPARVVLGKPDLLAANFHGGGKAAVEIDEPHVVEPAPGHVEREPNAAADRGRRGKIDPLRNVPMIVTVGAAVQKHPVRLRNAETARGPYRSHY